ncbi:MAG: PKD domain-containing protein [Bacteroidia bacterium]
MKNLIFKIVLIALFFSAIGAKADHIMGSDITYRCSKTNDSVFTIIINFYRDCRGCYVLSQSPKCGTSENCASAGTVPSLLTLDCVGGSGNVGQVSMTRVSIKDITRTCKKEISKCEQPCNGQYPYGIEKHTFEGTIDLRKAMKAGCCRFSVSTANICCRSVNITTGPSGGFYTYLEIDACKKPCNTSPQLTNDPVAILCCNQPYFFNNGAVDTVNFDSLSYSLVNAYSGKGTISNYSGGFSGKFPLTPYFPVGWDKTKTNPNVDPPIGIFMDPETGDLIFTPTECGQEAILVMQIDEWRKNSSGKYENIGLTRRDMHFIIQTCPANNPPTITNKVFKFSVCAETQICFDITTKDVPFVPPPPAKAPAPDTVTLTWNRGIPGATFTIKNQKAREQVGTFCWTPKKNQASDLPYTFTATAKDDACPKNALTTRSFSIYVKPLAETKRIIDTLICGKYTVESKLFGGFKTPAQYLWEVSDSTNKPLTKANYFFKSSNNVRSTKSFDTVQFRKGGKYIIHHRINNSVNCPSDYFDTVVVPPLLEVDLALGPDTFVCIGTTLRLGARVSQGVPSFKYKWFTPVNFNPKDTLYYIDLLMDNTLDSTFRVEISDKNKCTAFDTINVFLKKNPKVDMGPDKRICWYDSVTITPNANFAFWIDPVLGDTLQQGDSLWWQWKHNDIDFSTDTLSRIAQKGVYTVNVRDSLGCNWTDTMLLLTNDTLYPNAGPDQVKCFNDTLCLSASGLDTTKSNKKTGTYLWFRGLPKTPPSFTSKKNPCFKVQTSSPYLLELQVKEDTLRCFGYDTVDIKVNPLPTITVVAPQKYCCNYGNIALGSSVFGSPIGGDWSCRQNATLVSGGNTFLTPLACNPTKAGIFTLIYTYMDPTTTCVKYDSTFFTINPLPSLKLDGGTICQNAEEVPLKPYIKAPLNLNSMVDIKFRLLKGIAKTGGGTVIIDSVVQDKDPSLNYEFWIRVSKTLIDLQGKNKDSVQIEITIQDGQGCFNKDTAWFYIIGVPVITFNGFPDLCIDAGIVNLNTINNTQPLTGKWTVIDSSATKSKVFLIPGMDNNNGDTLNTNLLSLPNGPGLYKMRYTDLSTGCYIKRDTVLRINPLPNVNISISPAGDKGKFCEVDGDVTLNASPAGGTWTSSIPGVISAGKFKPSSVTALERDKFITLTYTYVHPTTKCDTSKSLNVFVQSKPTIDIITPDIEKCRTDNMQFTLNADAKFTSKITWYHSANSAISYFDNNLQAVNSNPATFNIKPRGDSATQVLISCLTENEGVCPFAQDFLSITIYPKPRVTFTVDDPDGCVPHTIALTSRIANGVDSSKATYSWDFGDGGAKDITQNAIHTYTTAGTYQVNLKITSEKFGMTQGCDTTVGPLQIDAHPIPVADFTPNPNNATTKALPRFRFTNESSVILGNKIISHFWEFDDEAAAGADTSSQLNPEYYYKGDTGIFYVSLIVETEHGCRDTIIKPVIIGPDILVYIPNVFTPDGAGPLTNDKFRIVASGIYSYQLLIFNRWGEKIYESHNLNDQWDGIYKGELAQMDAYVYEVQVTSFSNKLYKYSGTVILAR